MLNIASSPSFAWTPAASATQPAATSPVGAVTPVRSVQSDQRSSGDARTGNGPTRDRPATALVAEPARASEGGDAAPAKAATYLPDPAPLLPRQKSEDGQGRSQQEAADEPNGAATADSTLESAASAAKTFPPPQEMVSSVWLASAAVVDPVLEAQLSEARSTQATDTAPDLSVVAATQVARSAMANKAGAGATPLQAQIPLPFSTGDALAAKAESVGAQSAGDGTPAAYDERGNAARSLPESGSLLSERV